ncbi:MAG TPA: cupin domain-containing protein [Thermoanaerobaculia bacterium]|nr:cupin domain-containing protein [Thermoanaerobaculia bacterium]
MTAETIYNVLGDRVRVLASGDGAPYEMFEWHGPENSGPPPHAHPWTESYFVIDGEADVVIGDKTLRATPGCFMSVPPDTVHTYRVTSPGAKFLVVTSPSGLKAFVEDLHDVADLDTVMKVAAKHQVAVGG